MHICLEKRERENGASSATEEKSGKADHDPFVIRTVSVHACLRERQRETSLACEAVAASAAIMATMGVPTSGEGVAAAAPPQLERQQSVCEKVESSRQWSEVKRGGPRKGERKRSWIGREGRGRSESGERIKLNFAHFLKGGRGLCGGANDVCLLRAMGRCFLSVFDICSTDCVALPSVLVSGTEAKQYIISQRNDGGRGARARKRAERRREMAFRGELGTRDRRATKKANCSNRFNGRDFAAASR